MTNRAIEALAGDLALCLRQRAGGIILGGLRDLGAGCELLATPALPLFRLTVRHALTGEERVLQADAGWSRTSLRAEPEGCVLDWEQPQDEALPEISVRARAVAHPSTHAWHWSLEVRSSSSAWGIWRVIFPQLALGKPGDDAAALVPAGPGQLRFDAWENHFRQEAKYPGGWWWGLQFVAAYASRPKPTGLYLGLHDALGSTKDILMESDIPVGALRVSFDHPAPGMGQPGNAFALGGEAVWQLLRGDWFDAAMIYKAWASEHAAWWPALGPEGREDTPLWMRELSVWAMGGWGPDTWGHETPERSHPHAATTEPVRRLRQFMGIPMGFHWYRWHQIPFDNDYPHYFPALPGFAQAVSELQAAGIRVMPYINGRLWDTRDRGMEDWQFSQVALPAATKDEKGQPYIETYGSLEADGSPVKLAPMCPTTALWQRWVREMVERLMGECGVDGVYIDQVAAADAKLCMDATHGHPLGGGHWWNEGYWRMIEAIRAAMPEGRMITTECNAESFARWFDGYLTWHWQQDNAVPVFPAVYGGVVQMFGRNYGGTAEAEEPTQALAWRMRAGQQFIFGEQIGWFNLRLASERMPMDFIRQAARLRWRLRRFFYAGEMARPPVLLGAIPRLRANWQWHEAKDNPWVHTDALMASVWRMRHGQQAVVALVNVSDEPIHATVRLNVDPEGGAAPLSMVPPERLARLVDDECVLASRLVPAHLDWALECPARRALAILLD